MPARNPRSLAAAAVCALAAVALWGCPQPITSTCGDGEDGGSHAGADSGSDGRKDDAGTDAGGDAGTGSDSDAGADAGSDAGWTEPDGGWPSRADAGVFSWAIVPGTSGNETVHAIHGNSLTNVYAAADTGRIYHSSGGAFSQVYIGAGSNPQELYAVYVSAEGKVFSGGNNVLIACTNASCAQQSDFVTTSTSAISPSGGVIYSVCGRGEVVYAVGEYLGNARVWQYDSGSSAWVVRVPNAGASAGHGCVIADDGDLYFGTRGPSDTRIVRMTPGYLTFAEHVDPQAGVDLTNSGFNDVFTIAGKLYATGDKQRIIERDPATKVWKLVFNPVNAYEDWFAIGGGAPDELYASGDPVTDRELARYDGASWAFISDSDPRHLPYYMHVMDIWAPTPDTVYMAGQKSFDGVVIFGTR